MVIIRQFFRYIRDGFKNIWNDLFMSLSSVITLTLTLSLCALFVLFAQNTSDFTQQVEGEIKIFAEFSKDATPEEITNAISIIEADQNVADITHITKEKEYTDFIQDIGEDDPELAAFFENTSDENPLVDTLIVAADDVKNVNKVAEVVKAVPAIEYVDYGEESSLAAFANITNIIRQSFSWIVLILLVLAVFLIQNTIKLTIYARKNELKIMKLVGASVTHVTVPFLVEGLIIGILGAVGPILFTIFGYQFLYQLFGGVLVIPMLQMTAPFPAVYELGLIMGIISIVVSLVGSFLAVIKYSLKI